MISHEHECIFVHIPKNAGQSVEQMFLRELGLDWEHRSTLLLRPNSDPSAGPPRLAHLTAREYVSCGHVDQETFDRCFRFATVRNPWHRAVSMFRYRSEHARFDDFVRRQLVGHDAQPDGWFFRPQADYLLGDAGLLVPDLVRFEELDVGIDRIRTQLGIAAPLEHRNPSPSARSVSALAAPGLLRTLARRVRPLVRPVANRFRRDLESYRSPADYYSDRSAATIRSVYAEDFELLGYDSTEPG